MAIQKTTQDKIIIMDSSALISLLLEGDSNHSPALKILKQLKKDDCTFIIPDDVYVEIINITGKKWGHEVGLQAAQYIQKTKEFLITDSQEIYNQALEKYSKNIRFPSFTDCIVMAIADKYQTNIIFGFDECFSKNGYKLPS